LITGPRWQPALWGLSSGRALENNNEKTTTTTAHSIYVHVPHLTRQAYRDYVIVNIKQIIFLFLFFRQICRSAGLLSIYMEIRCIYTHNITEGRRKKEEGGYTHSHFLRPVEPPGDELSPYFFVSNKIRGIFKSSLFSSFLKYFFLINK
jgi:hypothetical protein